MRLVNCSNLRFAFDEHSGFVGDVFSAPGSVPADWFDGLVGSEFGFGEVFAESGDAEDAAAVGVDVAFDEFGAGMEDFGVFDQGGFVETTDFFAIFIRAGIAFGGHDDADCRARIPFEAGVLVEFAFGGGHEEFGEVALEPHENRLGLGVAEADVVFEDFGAVLSEHDAGVEDASEGAIFFAHRVDSRDQDVLNDFFHRLIGDERSRAVGTHAAGVRTLVAVEGGFVVLRGFEWDNRFAVNQGEDTCFLAFELFFNDNSFPSGAEFFIEHHATDNVFGFINRVANGNPFSSGQAIGFDDDGFGRAFGDGVAGLVNLSLFADLGFVPIKVVEGVLGGVEAGELGGGDFRFAHQILGEDLASLEFSCGFGRAEDGQSSGFEGIDDPEDQGSFRAGDCQVDFVVLRELHQSWDVGCFNGDVLAIEGGPCVAGGAINLGHLG